MISRELSRKKAMDAVKHIRGHVSDSNLAYYTDMLEDFDQTINMPLYMYTWGRDIKLRSGVSIGVKSTSFTRSTYGSQGSYQATGKPWISPSTTQLTNVTVDGEKVVTPVRELGQNLQYSVVDLRASERTQQPLDTQQQIAFRELYNQYTDEMVYLGDDNFDNSASPAEGLLNSSVVTSSTVPNGASGFPEWSTKTADEILADINDLLTSTWEDSAYAVVPAKLGLPPAQWSELVSRKVSGQADKTILKYVMENNIATFSGVAFEIVSMKLLNGVGAGGTQRMIAYTNSEQYVRFPMAPVESLPTQYNGVWINTPYMWAYGSMEFPYPETVQYADGI